MKTENMDKNIDESNQEQKIESDKSLSLGMLGEENVRGENYYKSTPIVTNYYYHKE